jgi:type IV pilus assembly protein PilB
MQLTPEIIKKILLEGDYVSVEDMATAEVYATGHRTSVIDYLMSNSLLSKEIWGQAIAEYYHVTYADLHAVQPTKEQLEKIPEDIAKQYRIVFLQETATEVVIATDDPTQKELAKNINALFPKKAVMLSFALPESIDSTFVGYKKSLDTRFSKILKESKAFAPEILQEILLDAIAFRASDIHFEPQAANVVIRFRIDGVIHEAGIIPREFYDNVLNRIKVQSRLRIDEHSTAQDGSMQLQHDTRIYDIRTSVVPTVEGEKIVLRSAKNLQYL